MVQAVPFMTGYTCSRSVLSEYKNTIHIIYSKFKICDRIISDFVVSGREKEKMIERAKRWLGLEKKSDHVRDMFDFGNMRTSLYMSVVIIALELWMIVSAIYGIVSGERARTMGWIAGHMGFYLLMITAAAVVMVYSFRCLKRGKNDHHISTALFMGFSVSCILFGTYISYNDYVKGEHLMAFVSMEVFALCLIVWPPVVSLVLSSVSFIVMYLLMRGYDGTSYATGVNFFVMWVCLQMSSMGNYAVRISNAHKEERLFLANEQIKASMLRDELTGLKNRACMTADIKELIDRDVIVAMVDADDFKYINETYNHTVGDKVLGRVASSLNRHFSERRSGGEEIWFDYYRYGGDGFILFASGIEIGQLREWIRDWQRDMHSETFEGTDIRVSMSCGMIEGHPADEDDLLDMIRYSDHILYEAKMLGRMQMLSGFFSEMKRREKDGRLGARIMSVHETDPVTGLPNMLHFRRHAGQVLEDAKASGAKPEYLYFDLINFKEFNEAYGFLNGDQLLKQLGEYMLRLFRHSLVARISDDHFIVLSTMSAEESISCIESLKDMLRKEQRGVVMGLRVGIYRAEEGDTDASLACDRARIACNSIKNSYDAQYYVYDKKLEDELHRKHYIAANIDKAIENGYIRVFYQPIVRLDDGKLCDLEALARWDDPVYGMLSPAVFIDVLENHHLIHKLDIAMTELVCINMREAIERGLKPVPISLNFSRKDFDSCDMAEKLIEITDRYGISHDMIEVEITESALTDHADALSLAMKKLKAAGFKLWLDDFGSGYSSLNSLKDFPFDVLKIDMKFLAGFEENERTKPILSSVVHMSDEIGMMALSEGVETDEQREFLRSIGCERAQGYFFGKPMDKEDVVEFISSGKLMVIED